MPCGDDCWPALRALAQLRSHMSLHVLGILLLVSGAAANFHEGDFIPSARRAQFHGARTHWHDLLGRHCPRFGQDTMVAIPLPQPKGFVSADRYKIQFAFDGDRLVTPWLKLLGKGAPDPPLVHIFLKRSGDVLKKAKAEVKPVFQSYLYQHHQLMEEFRNATHWPKHLLVQYSWQVEQEVDALGGLYVVFAICIVAFMAMAVSTLLAYEAKLKVFMAEIAGDDPRGSSPASAAALVKGD